MSEISAKQLRLALFTGNYDYIRDGVALTLNRLVAFLEKRGIAVLVFAPTANTPAMPHAGELVSVPSLPIPFHSEYRIALGFPNSARQKLIDFRPNLFLLAAPDVLGQRALNAALAMKVPVVASFHTRLDTYLKFYRLGFLENWGRNYLRRFYMRCRMVYPPSQSMADILREQGIATNLEVWGRGIDSALFSPEKRSLAWRRSVGIADTEVVVNFVSRLVKEKNTAILVQVLQQLTARKIAFKTLIVGLGPEEDHLRAALPNAIFAGHLGGEDLAQAYASSDIFFFPSESETFGNVTLEAMASGLPTVCADASGSNSLVDDKVTGYLQDAKKIEGFVQHIAELVQNASLRKAMGDAARKRALTFNWDAILEKLLASFVRIANEKSASP
jgi:phosphatidylinositol alpha 1,6-mannosyltransferase